MLIDGKRQPMTGTELADYLRALPAEQLKNIELITNPPAKYEAQGSAGIIAINLKKDQRQGTNGTLNASYGRSQYGKFTSGLTLNHRHKNLNLFGSYAYADRNGVEKLNISRRFYQGQEQERTLTGSISQVSTQNVSIRSHTWKAGADYNLGERTVLGAVVSGLDNQAPLRESSTYTSLFDETGNLSDSYRAVSVRGFNSPNVAANLNFKHTFAPDSSGSRELTTDADYARYTSRRPQDLTTYFKLSGRPTVLLSGDQRGDLTIQSAKVDYTHPVSKTGRIEAGAKASRVHSDNDAQFMETTNGETTVDLSRTNRFKYDENITAAYLSFNQTVGKLNVQAGLRGEHTAAVGRQTIGNQDFERNYFQLFPSAGLKHTLNDRHEVSLSVSRRVDRPSYGQLNPFRVIIDPTTSGAGNPELRPQTSYNFELGHTYKQKFSASLSYSTTDQPIIHVVQPESDSTVVARPVNLGRQQHVGITLTAPLELAKWWTMHNTGVFYYNQFVGSIAGTSLNAGRSSFNFTSNSNFTLSETWSAELNARYQAKDRYGFFMVRPYGLLTLGIQKSVWERKGSIKLAVADLLYTRKIRANSTYDNYTERVYQRNDSRVATLSFSYRFGNDKVAPTRRRAGGQKRKRTAPGSRHSTLRATNSIKAKPAPRLAPAGTAICCPDYQKASLYHLISNLLSKLNHENDCCYSLGCRAFSALLFDLGIGAKPANGVCAGGLLEPCIQPFVPQTSYRALLQRSAPTSARKAGSRKALCVETKPHQAPHDERAERGPAASATRASTSG
ncbi:outer membrane beta-barrel family protein [Hymenobacter volaticus]|uniref:Outer membrane beta-barrel family protein n=1 Tax=Hymenobacter volaticus TaxID=2932254 RepID=A0ABY4G9L9_9BACT|nr:outer membrane beta-barrel family protein [Hymenobacter volaticus]UOQ67600.1 outer membrane beta-barrel family protein [Hymenobacter volaticus]